MPEVDQKWRDLAEARCNAVNARLTPARWSVYTELVSLGTPLSAYDLISLQEKRLGRKIAPLTIYRHLDFLINVGLVHKIESTHTYVACFHPEHEFESQYLLCSACGRVDELESSAIDSALKDMAQQRGFHLTKSVVELSGFCEDCSSVDSQPNQ